MDPRLDQETFGKDVSLVMVGRILKKLNMSAQRPSYRSWKQDPVWVEKWKRKEHPAIKARGEGGYHDLVRRRGIGTNQRLYHAGTTWAPVGQTPVVTGSAVRQVIKMVSTIGQRGGVEFPGP